MTICRSSYFLTSAFYFLNGDFLVPESNSGFLRGPNRSCRGQYKPLCPHLYPVSQGLTVARASEQSLVGPQGQRDSEVDSLRCASARHYPWVNRAELSSERSHTPGSLGWDICVAKVVCVPPCRRVATGSTGVFCF